MNLIKRLESILYDFFILGNSTFWSHSFRSVPTCVLVLHDILDTFIRVWRQLAFLRITRSFCHQGHFWLSYPWNVIWPHWRLSRLSLCYWFWHITWWLSFFVDELLPNHVLHWFWMLVFWACVWHFSPTESVSALCHTALVVCTILRFDESPRFILLLWSLHRFYSWYVIFHIQSLLSSIRSVQ